MDSGGKPVSRNRFAEYVLIEGDRLLLTLLASVIVFALLVLLHSLGVIGFTNDDSVTRLASGMIAGTFSLITLVVSVNQLILSQEFSPADEFRDRLEGVLSYRRDVEDATNVGTAPGSPTQLIDHLAEAIGHRATVLADTMTPHDDGSDRELIRRYTDSVTESTAYIDERIDPGEGDVLDALSVAVGYDDAWQLYAARYLRNEIDLSEETAEALDDLIEVLRLFSTAQAHLKTIYLQRELTRFSQLTIYAGVPALIAAALIILLYGELGGGAISATYLPYVTALLATVVFVPLALLATYILRTATLTRRTAAVGPMYIQTGSEGPFETPDDGSE